MQKNNQLGYSQLIIIIALAVFGAAVFFISKNQQTIPDSSPQLSIIALPSSKSNTTSSPKSSPNPTPTQSSSPSSNTSPSPESSSGGSPSPNPTGRFIKVTYPNGGENFNAGETVRIKWSYSGLTQCLITFVLEDGSTLPGFYSVKPSDNYYDFKIPTGLIPEGSSIKAKVDMECYDAGSNGSQDRSDNFFIVKG